MKKIHKAIRSGILQFIDFFHPLFKSIFPIQTFRYAACGGTNVVIDITVFYLSYNYLYQKQNFHLGFITISPYIASFITAFSIAFPIGFYLSRYIVFQGSDLKRRTQLLRYFQVAVGSIAINYVFLKFLIEYLGWYPTPAKLFTTLFVIAFSYLCQTYYTFRLNRN